MCIRDRQRSIAQLRLYLEKSVNQYGRPYLAHLTSSQDLMTTPAAKRAGFVAAVLGKSKLAHGFIRDARTLRTKASAAHSPEMCIRDRTQRCHPDYTRRGGAVMGELGVKVALVTGAARGIGRAVAEVFVREGAAVMIADLADSDGAATAATLRDAGGQAAYTAADVTLSLIHI